MTRKKPKEPQPAKRPHDLVPVDDEGQIILCLRCDKKMSIDDRNTECKAPDPE